MIVPYCLDWKILDRIGKGWIIENAALNVNRKGGLPNSGKGRPYIGTLR
jgi:hypothetical protein